MKGAMSMYDYRGKIGGFIGTAVGLAGMVAERIHGFVIFPKYNELQHYAIFEWVMLGGLFVVIYSKEKHEDERTKLVRMKALQIAFGIQQVVILAQALTKATAKTAMPLDASELFLLGGMGIIFYLLIFHIGLYFDFLWEYEDKGVAENLRNMNANKWGKLVYLLAAAVMLLILWLLF